MTRNEAIENLKNSTVKIDTPDRVGSGFFIDKNLIATCYHVIEGCSKKELAVIWDKQKYQVKSIESNPADDLAILEVNVKNHPSVKIDKTINLEDKCYSFGFPENYRETGDPLSFEYEGSNDKFLKFKNGQFESGFSGSPILNLQTLKVCGIIKKTRDEQSSLGGRGISISKLLDFERLDIDNNGSIFSKEMFKNWVWTSSVESADKLQFSVLALVETLVAIGLSFYVWIYYDIYEHIIIGPVVAPFFFLQTPKSKQSALVFFNKYAYMLAASIAGLLVLRAIIPVIYYGVNYFNTISLLFINLIITLLFLGGILLIWHKIGFRFFFIIAAANLIKILFTVKYISFRQIKSIPKNWFRLVLSIDTIHPLEIIPGISKSKSIYKMGDIFNELISLIYHDKAWVTIISIVPLGIVMLVLYINLMVPMIVFRYSLKSTAWIYLPLIWLIQPQANSDLTTRIKEYSQNFIAYLMFFYSMIVVFVFTLLPLIFPYTELGVYLQNLAIPSTLKEIFFAYEFNVWHLTRFLSALITIVFMVSFTKILIRRESEPSYGNFWGAKLLSLRYIRGILALITLGFTAYQILALGLLPDGFFMGLWEKMRFTV